MSHVQGWVTRGPGLRLLIAMLGLLVLALGFQAPAAHAASGAVLILDSTVSGGASSREAQAAEALGYTVQVVNGTTWDSMTTAQFASYAALIIGDPTCQSPDTPIAPAISNSATWAAAATGNIFVIGSDPTYHASYSSGAATVIKDGVAFATGQAGATGAYITLSCYYTSAGFGTPLHVLDGFDPGAFTVQAAPGCFNDSHIVAASSALAGLNDSELSNWSCSVHEMFDKWSPGFQVLAIARGAGSYVAPDGSTGQPYVLARGKSLAVVGNFTLSPTYDTKTVGQTETLTANLTLSGSPVPGTVVNFSVSSGPDAGATGTATTDSSGNAAFAITGKGVGTDILAATYVDGSGHSHTSNTASVVWSAPVGVATNLQVQSASGTYGGTTTLSATLSSGTADLGGQTVTFTVNGTSVGSAVTDSNGVATLSNVSLAGITAGSYASSIAASFAGATSYFASSGTAALTVDKATPSLSWATPGAIVYGTALSAAQLDATASFGGSALAGSFSYAPAAGVVLDAGQHPLSASFTPTDGADFVSGGTVTTTISVDPAPLTVTGNDASREYGASNPAFSGVLKGVVNGDNITASYSTAATATSDVGTYAIVPTLSDPNGRLGNYSVTSTNGTLTITPAHSATSGQNATVTYGAGSVSLTASVGSDTGITVNEGTVTFTVTNGSTTLGTVSANVSGGSASAGFPLTGFGGYNLDAGSYGVSGSYADGASPANFLGSTSATSAVLTINKAALSVSAANATMIYGGSVPPLSGTLSGVVSPDGIVASYSTTATNTSTVGSYTVTPALSDPNGRLGNYTVTSANGTLTITPAHTKTSSASVSLTYGVASTTLSATVTNTDTPTVVNEGVATFTLTSSTGSQVAQVTANVHGGSASTTLSLTGIHAGTYSVSVAYSDGASPANFQASSTSVSLALLYNFTGFLQPIPAPVQTFKVGSGLPVKFRLLDANGDPVSGVSASLSATVNGVSLTVTSKGGANSGTSFRYDPSGQLYIYDLDTKGLATGTLVLTATLDDGMTHSVTVTLK